MSASDNTDQESLPADLPENLGEEPGSSDTSGRPEQPHRNFTQMMRKIPVTLTLEVGAARISLQELASLQPSSVVELDTLAGEPLVIKVNGTPIGRAEVVVSGENYGLRVLELTDLDMDSLGS